VRAEFQTRHKNKETDGFVYHPSGISVDVMSFIRRKSVSKIATGQDEVFDAQAQIVGKMPEKPPEGLYLTLENILYRIQAKSSDGLGANSILLQEIGPHAA